MARPVGSKNKSRKPPTKSVHVRVTDAELRALRTVHASPGKALHALIAQIPRPA